MNKLISTNKEPKNAVRAVTNSVKNVKNSISSKISNVTEKSKETMNSVKEKVQNASDKIKNAVKIEDKPGTINMSTFASVDAFKDQFNKFEESNTAITKFVFIVVLLLLFVVFFQLGSWLIQSFLGANKNPILLDGMVSANKVKKIVVNPNEKKSIPIYRSINQDQGIEFTWNVWIFVDSLNPNKPSYSRIFSKGSDNRNLTLSLPIDCMDDSCKNIFNSSPGLFITQKKQKDGVFPNTVTPIQDNNNVNMILVLNTFKPSSKNEEFAESITIENMPVQKWVCATIRVQHTTVDVYINGMMTQRKILNNVPKQNYYDVLIGDNTDGFMGSISSLRYYSHALAYDEIQSLYGKGPNLKSLDVDGLSKNGKDYISMNWYYKA